MAQITQTKNIVIMTQEEKAKAYDKALESAREALNDGTISSNTIAYLQDIFPELKESEDDRIKEDLIQWINEFPDTIWRGHYKKDVIAWLEKQGKKPTSDTRYEVKVGDSLSVVNGKPFDYEHATITQKDFALKDEPKFKVGDWITDGYVGGQITSIEDNYSCYKITDFIGGINTSIPFTLQDNYHLWTIQDAKDGDVLQLGKVTAIFKKFINYDKCECYCSIYNGEFEIRIDNIYGCYNATPATKEQRDLLFAKMKEAGYEWDAEKKEVRGIEKQNKNLLSYKPKFKVGDKLVSTKNPRLTYEVLKVGNVNELGNLEYEIEIFTDEKPGIQVWDTFKEHNIHLMECVKVDEWAKLVDEAKQKWTEEDEYHWMMCLECVEECAAQEREDFSKTIDWLKSIKKMKEQ